MDISNMRNMVVLRNLPSNIIEEAYVILKPNSRIKKVEYTPKKIEAANTKKNNSEDYIIKEAEMVISNYISTIEKEKSSKVLNLEKKYKKLKLTTYSMSIILFISLLINLIIWIKHLFLA